MIHVVRQILGDSTNTVLQENLYPGMSAILSKVHLVKAAQGTRRPYAVIDLENTILERSVTGIARETYNIMIYVTATSMQQAWDINEAIKVVLDEFTGTVTVDGTAYDVGRIALRDVMTDTNELHEYYIVQMMFDLYVL